MLILGIDPGTATTGYGLIKMNDGDFEVVHFGLIETSKDDTSSTRLVHIYRQLEEIITGYNPDIVAMERLFFATNAKTAMNVGHAQGVMMYCAKMYGREIIDYAPGTIKKMIAGSGRAKKKEMQQSLRKILGPKVRSRPHAKTHFDNAADALAVALTHIASTTRISLL